MLVETNIITGFLGVGKTTLIRQLLENKPKDEVWAVLVNEFGEVGIDGALLSDEGAVVKEVAGGCMCCDSSLPMQMALGLLLARAKPDRLLIEPTGLGHPAKILETLSSEFYREQLSLNATLTLVDPLQLEKPGYVDDANFKAQINVADLLVFSKQDLLPAARKPEIEAWANSLNKSFVWTQNGNLPLDTIRQPRGRHFYMPDVGAGPREKPVESQGNAFVRKENTASGHVSCGWIFEHQVSFDFDKVTLVLKNIDGLRVKAVLRTNKGGVGVNIQGETVDLLPKDSPQDSRIEVISQRALDWNQIQNQLLACYL